MKKYNQDIKRSTLVAYILWLLCFLGIFGVHRFYVGDYALGVFYALTFGFLGIAQLFDLFLIPYLVNQKNTKLDHNYYSNLSPKIPNKYGRLQSKLNLLLGEYGKEGEVYNNCSIKTRKGIKVATIAWGSQEFFYQYGAKTPLPVAPEICVEMLFPSEYLSKTKQKQITDKVEPYLAKGAKEVWLYDDQGNITIHTPQGRIEQSNLLRHCPTKIL